MKYLFNVLKWEKEGKILKLNTSKSEKKNILLEKEMSLRSNRAIELVNDKVSLKIINANLS